MLDMEISHSPSGIGKWRRTMHVTTAEKSGFSLPTPSADGHDDDDNDNAHRNHRNLNHLDTITHGGHANCHIGLAHCHALDTVDTIGSPLANNQYHLHDPYRIANNNNHETNNPHSHYHCSNSIPITPLHQIPYVHGGYAAAAPLFVTHSKFASILKKLLPGAYEELRSCLAQNNHKKNGNGNNGNNGNGNNGNGRKAIVADVGGGCHGVGAKECFGKEGGTSSDVVLDDPVKVMKWAENNPVVSAFGIWNSDSGRRTIKFMQGINLANTSNLDDNQFGIFNDWNDRESVVTIGSNGNQNGGGGGGGHSRNLNNPNNFQMPRRRKQAAPDNDESASMYGGIEANMGGACFPPSFQQKPSYCKPGLEWDVFLDPNLVRQVDAAMCVVDNLELKLRKARIRRQRRMKAAKAARAARRKLQGKNKNDQNDRDDDDDLEDNDDFDILQSHTAAQVEVDRLVAQLMRRTIIAHGSMSQLVLEAMGVAPKYNFGTVVKASREGSMATRSAAVISPTSSSAAANGRSPSRSMKRVSLRAGNTEISLKLDRARSMSWDEEEELHDFEALLDPSVVGSVGGNRSERVTAGRRNRTSTSTAPVASSSAAGSKGMFMETWIHVFARTLTLLVKSSGANSGSEDGDGILKKSSSSGSSGPKHVRESSERLLNTKSRPARIAQRGISGFLEKMFLRRDSSFPGPTADGDDDDKLVEGDDSSDERQNDDDDNNNNNSILDFDDDRSELLTNNDMFSPQTPTNGATYSSLGSLCGMSLCLGMGPASTLVNGREKGETSSFPLDPHASHKMAQDVERIANVLGEPLRLILDLKSRRVPPRVWSRLIDSMRTRGLVIEGIGSFDMDELRVIGKGCSCPLTPLLFFHSVGDLQRACHANEVKNGDTVYFNGGSLMWKRSSIMEAAERGCCGAIDADINDAYGNDRDGVSRSPRAGTGGAGGGNYSFQPYAYPRAALSDWERVMCKATIEDYRKHFNLKIGVYVQEFSISAEALDALSVFVNKHGDIYDQGLAFGGVNGTAVKNIHGDGYWNQRYMGRSWDFVARPSKEMTPLKPEDHHLVQKAIQAGAWGQVGTIYEVMDEKAGALTVPPPREPCNLVNTERIFF